MASGTTPASAERHDPARDRPELAVVVPTRNRPESLARCLEALARQTSRDALEIVVVDDGSDAADDVARIVASAGGRLVRHPEGRGPAAARDAGARAASAPFVAYTDDDCEAAPNWAERLLAALERGADVVAGTTVDASQENAFDVATQLIVNFLVERSREDARVEFAPSSNIACRADVLHAVPFDEQFRGYGEDRDWCARIVTAGHRIALEPAAVVRHHQGLDLRRYWRKHVAYGRGAYDFRHVRPAAQGFEPLAFYADLVRTGFAEGPAVGGAVALAQVATAAGFARQAVASRLAA